MITINETELQDFIEIYLNETGIEINNTEALDLALPLLNLMNMFLSFNEDENDI